MKRLQRALARSSVPFGAALSDHSRRKAFGLEACDDDPPLA